MTVDEVIEILEAYKEGKEIQSREVYENLISEWYEASLEKGIDTFTCDYRIKPEKETRPMTFEEIVAYWKEHRTEIYVVSSGCNDKDDEGFITNVNYEEQTFAIGGYEYSVEDIYKFVTKEDGTKFEV